MATAELQFQSVIPDLVPFRIPRLLEKLLGRVLGIDEMARVYEDLQVMGEDRPIADRLLDFMAVSYTTSEADLARARANMPRSLLGVAVVGDPDDVASGLAAYAEAGLRGLVLAFVNFNEEVPFFAEAVFPRLERLGLREPALG